MPFCHHRHQLLAEPDLTTRPPYMLECSNGPAIHAASTVPANGPGVLGWSRVVFDFKLDSLTTGMLRVCDNMGNDIRIFALPFSKPPGSYEWHLDTACGIRTNDGSGPDPSDYRRLGPVWQLRLWVVLAPPLLGLVAHPLAVRPNVGGQSRRPLPASHLGVS